MLGMAVAAGLAGLAAGSVASAQTAGVAAPDLAMSTATGIVPVSAVAASGDILAIKPCRTQAETTHLAAVLPHVTQRLDANDPVTVVAVGSSSTAGAGASASAFAYPNRLDAELRQRFPGNRFTVINRGINGEVIPDMVARMDSSVLTHNPDLVLWQLGTNTVVRDEDVMALAAPIRDGIRRIRRHGADVILIDPQYAPKVLEKSTASAMIDLIATLAREEGVAVFRRYAVMKNWAEAEGKSFAEFITPDALHLNDWGYSCFAHLLGGAIADALTPTRAAQVPPAALLRR
jgi:lysophospholipase L1-like esterase